jgi:hypothetical protein
LIIFAGTAYCQDSEEELPYEREFGFGINLNTNGGIIGGGMFKYAFHNKKKQYHLLALEIVNVKHAKEIRVPSARTGNTYVFNKENYFFVIRPQYGREFLLFGKAEEEGVRINGLLAAGISFGILKPYTIEYDYTVYPGTNGTPTDVLIEPFNPTIHTDENRILGSGGIFSAFNQSKFIPGFNAKAGLNFELGNSTTGVEVGGLLEIFPRKVNIVAQTHNTNIFTSIYVNIYFSARQ